MVAVLLFISFTLLAYATWQYTYQTTTNALNEDTELDSEPELTAEDRIRMMMEEDYGTSTNSSRTTEELWEMMREEAEGEDEAISDPDAAQSETTTEDRIRMMMEE